MSASGAPDLNRLRDIIRTAQTQGDSYPANPSERIAVGREGEIYAGDAPGNTPLSKVQHGTFAIGNHREGRDQQYAQTHMPRNTTFIEQANARGWCYSFTSEMGRLYTMFAYFDGRNYQVKLVEPRLEGTVGAHDGHLYSDGRLCLSESNSSGQPTLEEAYSKSVLWATGMDVVLQGYKFPFSINNV